MHDLERALENGSQKKLIRKINYDMKNKTALLRIEIAIKILKRAHSNNEHNSKEKKKTTK